MRPGGICIVAALFASVGSADVCAPAGLQGTYGFQLTGTTTIGSQLQPVVTVGRLVFDGEGGVTGVSSVSFTGLYLGNPVSGKYEQRTDCSVSWSLQDDSGNFQHFEGTMRPDGRRIQFRQTDPGGASGGTLLKSSDTCQEQDFRPRYRFRLTGRQINVDTAQPAGSVSAEGIIENRGGQLTLTLSGETASPGAGTAEVDGDCFVRLHLIVPFEAGRTLDANFRGILVDRSSELLGMATDPGTALSLRLTAP
ncbi:MAG TPA: hypothetical protein VKT49_10785 [Bryobacteraceae bacterium]|nr:hypothetical protein [Bryobacteraceae bacterium]